MYAMMCFFSLAAMDRFVGVLHGRKWLPFILCSSLAYLSHYAAIFLIYVQLVCLLPLLRRHGLFRRWFAAQMLALLPLAPWFVLYVRATWQTRALGIGWIPSPGGLALLRTLWNFGSGDTDTWPAWVLGLAVLHGLILVRGTLSSGRVRRILALWLFLPLCGAPFYLGPALAFLLLFHSFLGPALALRLFSDLFLRSVQGQRGFSSLYPGEKARKGSFGRQ